MPSPSMSRRVCLLGAVILAVALSPVQGARGQSPTKSPTETVAQTPVQHFPQHFPENLDPNLPQNLDPNLPQNLPPNFPERLAQNPAEAPAQTCAPTNIACRCSFQCCGEERCDGSICNQCVIDCVQRQQVVDRRSTSLRSRCQSLMTRGFKRL
jgi:hypothetical protein